MFTCDELCNGGGFQENENRIRPCFDFLRAGLYKAPRSSSPRFRRAPTDRAPRHSPATLQPAQLRRVPAPRPPAPAHALPSAKIAPLRLFDMDSAVVYPHDTSSKTSSLKRTISKCSLTDGDALVYKKLSPMHAASVDDGSAPVLLPRRARAPGFADEPEVSPAVSSPDSYYDRILDECTSPYDSPSAFGHCAESLTAARMFAALLDYLQDLAMCYASAMDQTFSELRQQLISTPFVVRQLQGIVQARLGLAWHLVNPLIELMQAFVSEVDFRDASVMELAEFVECCCGPAASSTLFPSGDVLVRLGEFYREVVAAFKRFLIKRWLQSGRITFPCEFGKKSDTLFLCMECHREHK